MAKSDTAIRSYPFDPNFSEARATVENQFVNDATYREMVEKTAIACTDVVFAVKDKRGRVERKLYLAKRNVYPMKDVWVVGGRIFFNDRSMRHSVQRTTKRETGIEFALSRFIPLSTHYYTWSKVAQGDFPGKNVSCTFLVIITKEEAEQISSSLTKDEYETGFGLQGYSRERIVREGCHYMLWDLYDQIFPSRKARAQEVRIAKLPIWKR